MRENQKNTYLVPFLEVSGSLADINEQGNCFIQNICRCTFVQPVFQIHNPFLIIYCPAVYSSWYFDVHTLFVFCSSSHIFVNVQNIAEEE